MYNGITSSDIFQIEPTKWDYSSPETLQKGERGIDGQNSFAWERS